MAMRAEEVNDRIHRRFVFRGEIVAAIETGQPEPAMLIVKRNGYPN
jgi:hypothetical protein